MGAYSIGFDIGGSHIAGALFDGADELARLERPYPKGEPEKAPALIAGMTKALEASLGAGQSISYIGIAVPGSLSRDKRRILNAYNLGFEDTPLPELIENELGGRINVLMANDADAAAWAEYCCGALRGYENCLLITLGTGVGGGVILNGALFTGGMGNGVELGHMIIDRLAGPVCSCGVSGCVEARCSATAIIRRARESIAKNEHSLIYGACGGDAQRIDAKLVIDAAKRGDGEAMAIFNDYVDALGSGIASIINTLDPMAIAIGGGVSGAGEFLLEPVRKNVEKKSFYKEHAAIVKAKLGNDAGIVGAALLHRTAK